MEREGVRKDSGNERALPDIEDCGEKKNKKQKTNTKNKKPLQTGKSGVLFRFSIAMNQTMTTAVLIKRIT